VYTRTKVARGKEARAAARGAGGGWLSGLSAAATPRAADEEDAVESDGDSDVALRGLRLPVGTSVFVDEGTKGGVSGRRAVPIFAVIAAALAAATG
jgi:hypothetical protein